MTCSKTRSRRSPDSRGRPQPRRLRRRGRQDRRGPEGGQIGDKWG